MINPIKTPLDIGTSILYLEKSFIKAHSKIALPTKKGHDFIVIADILYCQSEGNLTQVHLTSGKHLYINWMLGSLEKKLPETIFIRVHHQFIVNMQHVVRYEKGDGGTLYLEGDARIPVSREKKKAFLEKVGVC
jgi:two-component system, LytTR family, response regulator